MLKKNVCLLIVLIFTLSISLLGCSNNKNTKTPTNQNASEEKVQEEKENKNVVSKEKYKETFVSNYEKYIKNMDISDYDDLKNVLNDNNKTDNKKFVSDLKTILNDSKNNIASFRDSLKNLEVEDSNLNDLNSSLVKESDVLINDIDRRSTELDQLDKNIMDKSINDLINYLDDKFDDDKFDVNKFDDILEKIEDMLGINLD